jgi:hypothetical protein
MATVAGNGSRLYDQDAKQVFQHGDVLVIDCAVA